MTHAEAAKAYLKNIEAAELAFDMAAIFRTKRIWDKMQTCEDFQEILRQEFEILNSDWAPPSGRDWTGEEARAVIAKAKADEVFELCLRCPEPVPQKKR